MSTDTERELWTEAIKKQQTSSIWNKVYQVILGALVISILVYIGIIQADYQGKSRQITNERNKQLQQLLQSNEVTKAYIRCGVKYRNTKFDNDVRLLSECAKTETKVVPNFTD